MTTAQAQHEEDQQRAVRAAGYHTRSRRGADRHTGRVPVSDHRVECIRLIQPGIRHEDMARHSAHRRLDRFRPDDVPVPQLLDHRHAKGSGVGSGRVNLHHQECRFMTHPTPRRTRPRRETHMIEHPLQGTFDADRAERRRAEDRTVGIVFVDDLIGMRNADDPDSSSFSPRPSGKRSSSEPRTASSTSISHACIELAWPHRHNLLAD